VATTAGQLLVQRYVAQPLLVQNYKFDLRVYVLVTSTQPLEAWLYHEGLARFTGRPYSLDPGSMGDLPMHLTNYAVQREAQAKAGCGEGNGVPPFLQRQQQQQQQPRMSDEGGIAQAYGGTKCSLERLFQLLEPLGVQREDLWGRVAEVTAPYCPSPPPHCPHTNKPHGACPACNL
jgi:hypothetical protein